MVALLGLLEESQVFVEHLLLGEGDAVDAHELLALLVAAPVGAGERHYLYSLDRRGRRDVRTATEIGKRSLRICGDMPVFKFADQLAFIDFVAVAKHLQRVGFRDVFAHDLLLALGKLEHFLLDLRKIFGRDLVLARIYIIIETVFDCRTDTEFHSGIKFLQRLGQKVGRRVPERMLSLGVVPFEKLDSRVSGDRTGDIPVFTVHFCGKYIGREARRNAFGHLKGSYALGILPDTAVRKSNLYH